VCQLKNPLKLADKQRNLVAIDAEYPKDPCCPAFIADRAKRNIPFLKY
jgi:hypothetical protein